MAGYKPAKIYEGVLEFLKLDGLKQERELTFDEASEYHDLLEDIYNNFLDSDGRPLGDNELERLIVGLVLASEEKRKGEREEGKKGVVAKLRPLIKKLKLKVEKQEEELFANKPGVNKYVLAEEDLPQVLENLYRNMGISPYPSTYGREAQL